MKYTLFILISLITTNLSAQTPLGKGKMELSKLLISGKTYGAYCGIAGQNPPSRIAVEKLIKARDIEGLQSWLNSPNLVIQTYAAEAFIRLANNGIEVSQDIVDHVLEIKAKTDEVSTCTGCIYEKLTIKECLKNFELDDVSPQ